MHYFNNYNFHLFKNSSISRGQLSEGSEEQEIKVK